MKQKKDKKKHKKITDPNILEEIIRVDHAGEYGATRIYDGQIAVFGKNTKLGKTIKHMADQEQEHIEKFNELILKHKVRPTAFLPIWNIAGFALGAVERDNLITKDKIKSKNIILGLPSSGIHSNGFSLVRKIISSNNIKLSEKFDFKKN